MSGFGTTALCHFPKFKGLYIHVPFCASRCPYCDFYVLVSRSEEQHLLFVRRVLGQLDCYLRQQPDLLSGLETVFLGGGTPSLLGAGALSELLGGLETRLQESSQGRNSLAQLAEVSMESNPELIRPESLELWQELGIRRLSIGLQSHNDSLLRLLGRRSSRRSHEELARMLLRHFSGEYSFDFIYGIPGQTPDDIRESLDFIRRRQPHHVSYYELSIEEETLFGRWQDEGRWPELREQQEQNEEQFVLLREGLEAMGYLRYEVSNFARPMAASAPSVGPSTAVAEPPLHVSRHNELYWRWQPYLGLGPSAVGAALVGTLQSEEAEQTAKVWRMEGPRDWHSYLNCGDFGVQFSSLSAGESLWEYLLMTLRLKRGIDICEFARLFRPAGPEQTAGLSYREWAGDQLKQLLARMLPQSMHQYADFFVWQGGFLRLRERAFDQQGAFLRAAYDELLHNSGTG